jgi:transposase InsO family protein
MSLRRSAELEGVGRSGVKPRRIDSITRIALTILSGFFDWRDALVAVRPQTLIRWHRAGWKLFWRLKSRPGRPPIPTELRALIRRIANENPSWGEERIANELHPSRVPGLVDPLSESHLRRILKSWIRHYNHGRPHMALSPGVPDPPPIVTSPSFLKSRHRSGDFGAVRSTPMLGGLHHEYSLAPA